MSGKLTKEQQEQAWRLHRMRRARLCVVPELVPAKTRPDEPEQRP